MFKGFSEPIFFVETEPFSNPLFLRISVNTTGRLHSLDPPLAQLIGHSCVAGFSWARTDLTLFASDYRLCSPVISQKRQCLTRLKRDSPCKQCMKKWKQPLPYKVHRCTIIVHSIIREDHTKTQRALMNQYLSTWKTNLVIALEQTTQGIRYPQFMMAVNNT